VTFYRAGHLLARTDLDHLGRLDKLRLESLKDPDLASEVDARSFLPSHASLDLYAREASSSRKPSAST
jgi:hypothetical protein